MTHDLLQNATLVPIICCLAAMAGCLDTTKSRAVDATAGRQDAAKPDAADTETVVFQKVLDDGRQLIIVRSPNRPVADVAPPVISKRGFEHWNYPETTFFSVSLKLVAARGSPLTLANIILQGSAKSPAPGGFDVFDILINDGVIVVAVGWHGIELWRLTPLAGPDATWVLAEKRKPPKYPAVCIAGLPASYAPISRGPTFAYPDRKSFSVKLSLTGYGHVQADLDDLQAADKRHTRFVQVGDEWEFKAVVTKLGE